MTSSPGSSFLQRGFFSLHLAWEKEGFSPIISIRLAKVMAWGVFFVSFLSFLRKEADMLTRTMEDNLSEGEKEMHVRVRIWHSSIEEGRGMREPPWRKVELMIL